MDVLKSSVALKISPCKKCCSEDIELWQDEYPSSSTIGGTCNVCGYKVKYTYFTFIPIYKDRVMIWNGGQQLTDLEKANKLREQIYKLDRTPVC